MPLPVCWSPQLRAAGEASCSGRDASYSQRQLASNLLAQPRRRSRKPILAQASLDAPTKPAPSIDYVSRLRQYKYGQGGCPLLFLAPMENLADSTFRRAFAATIGGFDEACTEFIRIPGRTENPLGSIRGVSAWYDPRELGSVPLGAQIMGSSPELMGLAARYLVQVRGAPRVDLNCGCPANTVTGNGAGSSLLRTPQLLGQVVRAMVEGVEGAAPVSVKLRAGYDDTALMADNLLAAQEAGASFVALHPRTRRQAYAGAADWELIARAVELLDIPVVGNGDVVSVQRAHQLLRETGCHGLMVGRGAVHDPLLFLRIRHSFEDGGAATAASAESGSGSATGLLESGDWRGREPELVQAFLLAYASHVLPELGGGALPSPPPPPGRGSGQPTRGSAPRSPPDGGVRVDEAWCGEGGGAGGGGCGGDGGSRCGAGAGADEGVRGGEGAAGRGELDAAVRAFGRLKVVMRYLFASSPQLAADCEVLLRRTPRDCTPLELVGELSAAVAAGWPRGGPTRRVLYDHMNKNVRELVAA